MKNKSFIEVELNERTDSWSMAELHSHSYYEIYLLLRGSRKILFSDTVIDVSCGSCVVIPPFVMHKTEGGPFMRALIYLGGENLSKSARDILARCYEKRVLKLTEGGMAKLTGLFNELIALEGAVGEANDDARSAITGYFIHSLGIAERGSQGTVPKRKLPESVSSAIEIMNKRFAQKLTLSGICEELYISEGALCEAFKRHIGTTVGEYLTTLRISKAKELLFDTRLSLEAIAEAVGFSSANYLGLVFKKHVGIAPTKYRSKKKS